MSVQLREIVENFPKLLTLVRGSGDFTVEELQAPSTGNSRSLIFVANPLHLREAKSSQGTAWVVHKDLVEAVP
jgi:UDP-3-O-[3-hydroxymyristoyl] glucosamine N-acyltransferase